MRDPSDAAAAAPRTARARRYPRRNPFIQVAQGPEQPDVRDKAGRQRGMAIALLGAGALWAAVGAAAIYFLRG